MSTQEHTRELLTHERIEAKHLQQNALMRAAESLEEKTESTLNEEARDLLTQDRLGTEYLQQKVLMRATGSHGSA